MAPSLVSMALLLLCMAIRIIPVAATIDYLIAGGGTAGLVLASRLSEDPRVTVTVIEPGDDMRSDPGVLNLDLAGLMHSPLLDWNYKSTQQPQLGNRIISYPAGKAIGGTTVINGLYYIRGDASEYDAWETLGNRGWNWKTLLSHFITSESLAIPTAAQKKAGITVDPTTHGLDGPLDTGFVYGLDNGTYYDSVRKTWSSLGYPVNEDLNAGTTRGFGAFPKTIDRAANVRESAARAYYEPVASKRLNLQIIKGTVKKVTFANQPAGKTQIATGLEYVSKCGRLLKVSAAKEVILSAGTLVSPTILENSGIGSSRILNRLGITVRISLPGVGEGLQDQALWTLMYAPTGAITGQIPFATFASAKDLFHRRWLPLYISTRLKLWSWSKTISQRLGSDLSPETLLARFRVQHDLIFKKGATIAELAAFSVEAAGVIGISFSNLLPFSWGSVHLATPGEINKPAIDVNHLTIDFDVETAIAAGRLARKAMDTMPLSNFVGTILVPSEATLPANATDATWANFLTSSGNSAYHGVGTCAMLPKKLGGVVDSNLKVYGTANLRIVDASVIPQAVSGHTSAAVYAIAEKASSFIKRGL